MITIETVKTYDANLALFNKILDSLKLVYKSHKLYYKASKTPLELLVMVHNERRDSYRYESEIYEQALQALIDLVNRDEI